jgi:hypothetical protein
LPLSPTIKATKTPEDEINTFLKNITVSHLRRLEFSIMVLLKPQSSQFIVCKLVYSMRQIGPGGKMTVVKHGSKFFPCLHVNSSSDSCVLSKGYHSMQLTAYLHLTQRSRKGTQDTQHQCTPDCMESLFCFPTTLLSYTSNSTQC